MQTQFPKAIFGKSPATCSSALNAWIKALKAHIDGRVPRPDVPVDLGGPAFQIRVSRFWLEVPEDDVLHDSDVASSVGVPCHRVLRSDGESADIGGASRVD